MKKKTKLLIVAAALSPVLLYVLIICLVSAGLCIGSKPKNYQLQQEIENISYAQVADITNDEYANMETDVLTSLDSVQAQKLAQDICSLKGKHMAPPSYTIGGLSAIFYYSDGSCEIISLESNRYIMDSKTHNRCFLFDKDEFEGLLKSVAKSVDNDTRKR